MGPRVKAVGEVFKPLPDQGRWTRVTARALDGHQSGNVLYGV